MTCVHIFQLFANLAESYLQLIQRVIQRLDLARELLALRPAFALLLLEGGLQPVERVGYLVDGISVLFNQVFHYAHALVKAALHRRHLKTRRADIGPDVLALLDQGQFVLATDYLDAQRRRRQLVQNLAKLFDQVRVIVTPTTPSTAPKIGQTTMELAGRQEDVRLGSTRLVRALNLAGVPALSAPCGLDSQGLPIGLQIFGRAFDEAGVLMVGHAYEQATDWHRRRPPLAP